MSWMKVKRLSTGSVIPTRSHDTDAGLDVYTCENGVIHAGKDGIVKTGIAMAIPDGWVAVVKEKSGRATNNKLTIGACVIDSGYRGELLIHIFNNDDKMPFTYLAGEKIAQLVIVPCWTGQPEEVSDLDETSRGVGGFGSTGIKQEVDLTWEAPGGNVGDGIPEPTLHEVESTKPIKKGQDDDYYERNDYCPECYGWGIVDNYACKRCGTTGKYHLGENK